MSLIIEKTDGTVVSIPDMGLTLTGVAGTQYDLTVEQPNDVYLSAQSTGDLYAAIVTNGKLVAVDPREGASGNLNAAESIRAVRAHNDTHYGIIGGLINQIDDVDTTGSTTGSLLQYDGSDWVDTPPSTIATNYINLGDLKDVDDGTGHTNTVPYMFVGDGTNLDVVDATSDPNVAEAVEDIIGASFQNGTDTTFVYNDGAGTMQVNVNDVFLRNTGDTLDSGTLTIAEGATLLISADGGSGGATLTIGQDATATIVTPTGGFTGNTDIVNKEYVDSVAAGLDPKEAVRVSTCSASEDFTAAPYGGTYAPGGGPAGTGQFTGVDLSSVTGGAIDGVNFTGVFATGLVINDRVLVRNQADAKQNGIYYITASSDITNVGDNVTITRATDHDGTPANEVSGGNFTLVEDTTAINPTSMCSNAGWILAWDGTVTLNTDPVIWVQFSGASMVLGGIGLSKAGNVVDLDVDDLVAITSGIDKTNDTIAFHDNSATPETSGSQTRKITFGNFLEDLDIPNGIGPGTGIVVKTGNAPDTYTTRTITINGAGNLDGLSITNGDGVAANPQLGLDIQNMTARSDAVDTNDRVAVWNSTTNANEYYTVGDISTSGINCFTNWARTGNGSGGTLIADVVNDTATFNGGIGVDITTTPASDTIDFTFSRSGMADTAVQGTDTITFFDGSNSLEPEFRSFNDLFQDLDVPNGIGPGTGIVVKTGNAPDTYTTRSVVASTNEDELGSKINNGNGVAGNVEVGVDIVGQPDPNVDLAATDEFLIHDKSEGTGGANRKITGQNVSDGVVNIIFGAGTNVTITNINGQPTMVFVDSTRSKTLSVAEFSLTWSENDLDDNDWLNIGNAVDATSGYIMPMDATIVRISGHTADNKGATKNIDLYIDGVLDTASVLTFTGAAGEKEDRDETLDIDIDQGEKLSLRAGSTGGKIEDIVVTVWVKWRA